MQDISAYKRLNDIEFAKKRAQVYIGNTQTEDVDMWVFDKDVKEMKREKVKYNEGLMKIINEVIDNSLDNSKRNPPTTKIKVKFDGNTISVENDGCHIPIQKEEEKGDYIPSMVFGVLRTGSNYDDDVRDEKLGQFGLGVKLTNIFSHKFSIECNDPVAQKTLCQTWTDGMTKTNGPKIKAITKKKFSTRVEFTPNLEYFGVKDLVDTQRIIFTRLLQVLATCNTTSNLEIHVNGTKVKKYNFKSYIGLFGSGKYMYEKVSDNFEYGFKLSENDTFQHESFVNSKHTNDALSTQTKYVSSNLINLLIKEVKQKHKDGKISKGSIENRLHVFVNMKLAAPTFSTQNKERLITKINPSSYPMDAKKIISLMKRSGLVASIMEKLESNSLQKSSKALTGTKRRVISVDKLIDATSAGTKKSHKCSLFITEGDSALSMVRVGLSVVGREYFGGFPIRGKLINVCGMKPSVISSNEEIKNMVKILGLDVNKKYDTAEEYKTLRYGRIIILSDQDVDGSHIGGLIINFIQRFWPNLIKKHGFIQRFVTPYVKATDKRTRTVKSFYNMKDYEEWSEGINSGDYTVKAYKGLGTSTRADSLEYFRNISSHLKSFTHDEECANSIELVFDPSKPKERRDWLSNVKIEDPIDYTTESFSVSKFLNTEVFEYSRYSITRNIPSVIDGFKTSHRQVMHTLLRRSNNSVEIKVAQLASKTALEVEYLHGEDSLVGTIVGMAQSFCGSNNMPLLTEGGLFGSRTGGGPKGRVGMDCASGRYIFTKLRENVVNNVFTQYDSHIINYRVVEGKEVEPTFFVPTLPLVLINGANGIATGFRSCVPSFKIGDVASYIDAKLKNTPLPKLSPWYNGFTGSIAETSNGWDVTGKWRVDGDKLIITEIPVGVGTNVMSFLNFEKHLKKLVENNILVSYDEKNPDENHCQFVCTLSDKKKLNNVEWIVKTFQLKSHIGKNCFFLLDEEGAVRDFKSPEGIIDYWLGVRMKFIQKRKDYMVKTMGNELEDLNQRLLFVKRVLDGTIELRNAPRQTILDKMTNCGVKPENQPGLLKMSLMSITKEKVCELESTISSKQQVLDAVKKLTPADMYASDISTYLQSNKRKNTTNDSPSKRHCA